MTAGKGAGAAAAAGGQVEMAVIEAAKAASIVFIVCVIAKELLFA
jgi:hypothetical protein